jgi:aspartyl-tRNA(Asn)/glutamyl-tRNA(Gln) amidotransferase subunit A
MPNFDEEIFFASAAELGARLRKREFSCVELIRAFCDRLEHLGPRYNALALSLREPAIRQANDVDGDFKRERFRSPLHGIPFGAKDLLAVNGQITTWGAKPYAAQVFQYDATVIRKLQRAGAILIGKLAMVELAGGGGYRFANASLFGPGLNPWDRSRWSGGSSSGSGSAVAAGLVTCALGSETSGSILTPSAYSGVTGLRPTYGLVSRYGAMPLSWTMDKVGPMCRTVEDCAAMLQIISGKDNLDPASAGKSFYYSPRLPQELKGMRTGFTAVDFEQYAEPATRHAFRQALDVVRAVGLDLREVKMADLPYGPVTGTVISAEGSSVFEPLITSGRIDQLADKRQIAGMKAALEMPARDYLKAMRIRRLIQQELNRMLTDVEVLVAPARYTIANKIVEPLDRSWTPTPAPSSIGLRPLIPAGNLAGLPALSLPCGFADGMPVALQIVGRPWSENTLLTIGKEFQSRTDWHRRRPRTAIS